MNIESATGLAKGVINSIYAMTNVIDRSGQGFLFNHDRHNKYLFS